MELSIAYELYMKPHEVPTAEAMKITAAAGFRFVDMSLGPFALNQKEKVLGAGWQRWAEETRAIAADNGIVMRQAHCLLFNYMDKNAADYAELTAVNRHLMQVAAKLGVSYMVFHPGTSLRSQTATASRDESAEWLKPFVDIGEKLGVKICIENVFDCLCGDHIERLYGTRAEDLLELVDRLDSPMVGTCWDTGHAHIGRALQRESIVTLGDTLWVTHIHDNRGQFSCDLHIPPFYGDIRWQDVMAGLRDVGYAGTLNFELEPHSLPRDMIPAEFRSLYDKGQRLLQM